ncbi:MAG: hypothetical protein EA383_12635 [Spirochaetaceae bacterium]|nr:MAG: hypothetical protein EA383_12635 [Spirochaetaceae bacterium]
MLIPMPTISRKHIAIPGFFLLFSVSLAAQTYPSLIDDYELPAPDIARFHGQVEAIRVLRVSSEAQPVPVLAMEFSRSGKPVSHTTYGDGRFRWRSEFAYDERDRLVQWRGRNVNGDLEWIYEYDYDDQGRRVQVTEQTGSGLLAAVRNMQYRNDVLEEQIQYDGAGRVQWSRLFDWRDGGLLRTWTLIFADGGTVKRVDEHYSPFGRLVREEHFDQNNAITEVLSYVYDLYGRVQRVTARDDTGGIRRTITYEYVNNDYPERIHRVDMVENIEVTRSFEYRFDSQGNWTDRTERIITERDGERVGEDHNTLQRQIRYF